MLLSVLARSAPRQNTSSRRLRSGMGEQDGGHFSVIRMVACTSLTGKALSAARQTPKWISFTCMTWQVFLSANRNLQLCPLRPVICAREALALVSFNSSCVAGHNPDSSFLCCHFCCCFRCRRERGRNTVPLTGLSLSLNSTAAFG